MRNEWIRDTLKLRLCEEINFDKDSLDNMEAIVDEVIKDTPKHETVEETREWLISDIRMLPMNDIFKLYKYVRRYCIANIEGLIDPLVNHYGKPNNIGG